MTRRVDSDPNKRLKAIFAGILIALCGISLLLILVFIIGSARHAGDSASLAVSPSVPTMQEQVQRFCDKLPQSLTVRYRGQTADYWDSLLHDTHPGISQDGAFGLNQIGDEGLRFLLPGLFSASPSFRFDCLCILPYPAASRHKDVFLPVLLVMLQDDNAAIRSRAAVSMMHCGFKELLPEMRKAAQVESDPEGRKNMLLYIEGLEAK